MQQRNPPKCEGHCPFHAELIPIIPKILLWWLHSSWDLRSPEPRSEWVITTVISVDCNVATAASRAVWKGALATNCPSAIRDCNSFLCSCGDLINKVCKLIIIKNIITCQKDLIIWHSKLYACQWTTFMTKQIWSSWLSLSRSSHQSVLLSQMAHSLCIFLLPFASAMTIQGPRQRFLQVPMRLH